MKRKIVQIAAAASEHGVTLYALAEDGTCWMKATKEWVRVDPLPDADEEDKF